MTKDELRRMMSLVDEKYIDEITQASPALTEDFEPAEEVEHLTVQEAPRQSWRIWAALVAALVLCVPIGYGMANGLSNLQPEEGSSLSVGTDVKTDWAALVESMSDEEVAGYFLCGDETNFPPFQGTISGETKTDAVPFASAYIGKSLTMYEDWMTGQIRDSVTNELLMEADNTSGRRAAGICGTDEAGSITFKVLLMDDAAPLVIEAEPVYLPQFEDVAFYGRYREHPTQDGMEGKCFFQIGTTTYEILTDTLSQRELLTIVYEVMDSGATAESLDALYQLELANPTEPEPAENQFDELNEISFCQGWIPQLLEIGNMEYSGWGTSGDGSETVKISYICEETIFPYLYLSFHSKSFGEEYLALTDQEGMPVMTWGDWSSEAVNSAPYSKQGDALYSYQFMVNLDECWMEVEAECAPEDMEVLVQTMSEIIAEKLETEQEDPTLSFTTYEEQLAYLNSLEFCKGWIPQNLWEIGSMSEYSIGKGGTTSSDGTEYDAHVHMTWRDQAMYNHYLRAEFRPEQYGELADFAYAPIAPEEWSLEAVSAPEFCTARPELNGGNLNLYQFMVDWNDCIMMVEAQCTADEMGIFVQEMADIYSGKTGDERTEPPKDWYYERCMNDFENMKFCKDWIPDLRSIGNMNFGSNGYSQTYGKGDHVVITWSAIRLNHSYELTADWISKEFKTLDDLDYPVITAEEWSMETLSAPDYCTDTGVTYDIHHDHSEMLNLYNYQFVVDWGDCLMTVDASCTSEEMEIFVQAMSALYAHNQSQENN